MILLEQKQLGTLYHFTRSENLLSIIDDGGLKSTEFEYISFTRNFNLPRTSEYFRSSIVRFAFDGDRLSDKFKFEPFLDTGNSNRKTGEQEERVHWPRNKILPCFFALKQIDILDTATIPQSIIDEIPKIKLPIHLVKSFQSV